jgi:hypothetical protein
MQSGFDFFETPPSGFAATFLGGNSPVARKNCVFARRGDFSPRGFVNLLKRFFN